MAHKADKQSAHERHYGPQRGCETGLISVLRAIQYGRQMASERRITAKQAQSSINTLLERHKTREKTTQDLRALQIVVSFAGGLNALQMHDSTKQIKDLKEAVSLNPLLQSRLIFATQQARLERNLRDQQIMVQSKDGHIRSAERAAKEHSNQLNRSNAESSERLGFVMQLQYEKKFQAARVKQLQQDLDNERKIVRDKDHEIGKARQDSQ